MKKYFRKMFRDASGAAAIEYGLIALIISVAAVAAMQAVGINVIDMFEQVAQAFDGEE